MTAPTFYFQTHGNGEGKSRVPFDHCCICGRWATPTNANPFPQHDVAVHEVWAYATYGMHAVAHHARPYVQGWVSGEIPLPESNTQCHLCGTLVGVELNRHSNGELVPLCEPCHNG